MWSCKRVALCPSCDQSQGQGERPYTLSLPEEEVLSEAQQVEESKMKIEANISNYITEIARLHNVNKQEAEKILKENIKINSEVFEQTKHMQEEDEDPSKDNKKKGEEPQSKK